MLAACSSSGPDQGQFQRVDSGERPDLLVLMGMRAPPKPEIEYRPRSPLVLPGSTAGLQAPEEGSAVPQDFPVDPEIEIARERADRDQALVDSQQDVVQRGGIMTPEEVEDWENRVGSTGRGRANVLTRILNPREMRERQLAQADPESEPERQVLSQPPEGYRRIQPDQDGNYTQPELEQESERRWWQVWR
ncbi:MAG: hypothetical protein AAGD23_11070 [Pseudomonadota bacterium]